VKCVDVDECKSGSNNCENRDALCENTVGDYICSCPSGFAFNNEGNCKNIDECAFGLDDCDVESQTCYDESGGFTFLSKFSNRIS
jgi:hypothetical protein